MGSNEEYLDSLLRQVSGEAMPDAAETENMSGMEAEEIGTGERGAESGQLLFDEDEVEFPELARLFEEEEIENIEPEPIEQASIPEPVSEITEEMADMEPELTEEMPEPESAGEVSDIEEVHNMDISDLEALMESDPFGEDAGESSQELDLLEDADVTDLIDAMEDDDELAEISELLKKSDNSEMIDDGELSSGGDGIPGIQEGAGDIAGGAGADGPAETEGRKFLGRQKKKKEKKERSEKGPGFFQKIIAFFTEDDELEEEDEGSVQLDLAEENIAILEELDQEGGKDKSPSKPQKPKKEKKEKKPKVKKEKKPKPKKEKKPKPKKEKKPKEPKEPEKPLKPIGKKKIFSAIVLAVTIFGIIMICTSYIPDFTDRQNSKKAFQEGDYKRVYELLVTKEVKGQDEARLKGAMLCLEMERKLESYENFGKMEGMEVEQLHALVSGVDKYQKIQAEAEKYGVAAQVNDSYLNILAILQSEYGVSQEEAQDIALITDKVSYTKELKRILGLEVTADAAEE